MVSLQKATMQRKEWQGLRTTGIISGTKGTVTLKSIENTSQREEAKGTSMSGGLGVKEANENKAL